jgi:hypothetical protein
MIRRRRERETGESKKEIERTTIDFEISGIS